ncbi:hypothetical protein SBV1_1460012 [Verrucomicrobia bacterium]|nr:hypothetical protein SBV1_1460012 [Verrucomicrobiota bacterium]
METRAVCCTRLSSYPEERAGGEEGLLWTGPPVHGVGRCPPPGLSLVFITWKTACFRLHFRNRSLRLPMVARKWAVKRTLVNCILRN